MRVYENENCVKMRLLQKWECVKMGSCENALLLQKELRIVMIGNRNIVYV